MFTYSICEYKKEHNCIILILYMFQNLDIGPMIQKIDPSPAFYKITQAVTMFINCVYDS